MPQAEKNLNLYHFYAFPRPFFDFFLPQGTRGRPPIPYPYLWSLDKSIRRVIACQIRINGFSPISFNFGANIFIGMQGGVRLGGVSPQTEKFFVKNAIKTEFKRNFKKGGRKFPTDLGPCLGMNILYAMVLYNVFVQGIRCDCHCTIL